MQKLGEGEGAGNLLQTTAEPSGARRCPGTSGSAGGGLGD